MNAVSESSNMRILKVINVRTCTLLHTARNCFVVHAPPMCVSVRVFVCVCARTLRMYDFSTIICRWLRHATIKFYNRRKQLPTWQPLSRLRPRT